MVEYLSQKNQQIGGFSELIPTQILQDLNFIFEINVAQMKIGEKLRSIFVNISNGHAHIF